MSCDKAEGAQDIRAVFDLAVEPHGRIEAIVNHEGHPPKGELFDIKDDEWSLGSDMIVS